MLSLFRQFSACSCGILLAISYTQTCAESGMRASLNSAPHGAHDEMIAYVPRQLAETPPVALAKINIAVYRAKQLTEQQLCAGKWTPRGTLLYQQGPEAAGPRPYSNNDSGNRNSWYFQTFRHPQELVCPDITRAEYFLEMSRHLPEWISVRPAGQTTTFRLGQVFTEGQHSLAAR